MITKWFIGVSAKSKGYFTGFRYAPSYRNSSSFEGKKVVASFTKQTALARSYDTEGDALNAIKEYRSDAQTNHDDADKKLKAIQSIKPMWGAMSMDDKIKFLCDNDISIQYERISTGWGAGQRYTKALYMKKTGYRYTNPGHSSLQAPTYKTLTDFNEEEQEAIRDTTFKYCTEGYKYERDYYKSMLDFIDTKLVVRECEIEIKFKDSERREIKWEQRGDNATAGSYCNCCGGAVPSIPQLVIGRYRESLRICAICMGRLSEEAQIQSGKVDPEILEHYETDRFLRKI